MIARGRNLGNHHVSAVASPALEEAFAGGALLFWLGRNDLHELIAEGDETIVQPQETAWGAVADLYAEYRFQLLLNGLVLTGTGVLGALHFSAYARWLGSKPRARLGIAFLLVPGPWTIIAALSRMTL